MNYGNQMELFPELRSPLCIRHELGTCPAPCAGGCTRSEYEQQTAAALAYLRGEDLSILATLQERMFAASQRQAFERATICRNQFDDLDWLNRRLEMLRRARHDLNGLFPLPAFDHHTIWLVLQAGMLGDLIVTTDAPSSWDALQHRAHMVQLTEQPRIPQTTHEIYLQMILISWFRKHREDLFRVVSFDDGEKLARHLVA